MRPRIDCRFVARAVVLISLSLLMIAGLAACGSTADSSTTTTSTTIAVNAPLRVTFGSGSIGPSDPTTSVPTERGNPIPPGFAAGQNIIITAHGFRPQTLEANISAPVVWTNLSGHPVRIVFVDYPVDSGTIPTGGTFSWTADNVVALEYRSSSGFRGTLDMNPVNG